jgi:hypothetical protein
MVILYIILGIVLLILVAVLLVSKDANYEKSILIAADREKVWQFVYKLSEMDKWSPWSTKDPNMKSTLSGTDGTVGAKQSWESKMKNVGEGSQTISKLEKHSLVETKLEFIKPFKSKADAYIKLAEESNKTRVTWGFKSKMPYPMNLMKLFMNFEKSMDADFGQGLNKLKELCEHS